MTLLCERCYGPIDPDRDRYYRLAHLAHADRSGELTWNEATVHTDPCGPALQLATEQGGHRRAA